MALHLKSTGLDFADFTGTAVTGTSSDNELLHNYEEGEWTPTNGYQALTVNGADTQNNFCRIGAMMFLSNDYTVGSSPSDQSQTGGYCQNAPFTPVGVGPVHAVIWSSNSRTDLLYPNPDSSYHPRYEGGTTLLINAHAQHAQARSTMASKRVQMVCSIPLA